MVMISRFLSGVTVALLGATLLQFPAFAAEKRVALVIGNGAYKGARLLTPVNDARLMAQTLRDLGFDLTKRTDVDQKSMKRLIRDFRDRLAQSKGIGLFYYSGHGMEVEGHNYMIPVGAEIQRESDVEIEAVKVSHVLAYMGYARDNVNIVILDACRDNPYAKNLKSATKGLARMSAPAGSLIAYATQPGNVAIAGKGEFSPYTEALVKEIATPGLPVEMMFKEVAGAVHESTGGRQWPWIDTSLIRYFYFVRTQQPVKTTPATTEKQAALEKLPLPGNGRLVIDTKGFRYVDWPFKFAGLTVGKPVETLKEVQALFPGMEEEVAKTFNNLSQEFNE